MMWCPRCNLPDNYNGDGDGYGSCDCSRCDCCGRGPVDECDCRRDWDPLYDDDELDGDDWLCNDTACPWRRARVDAASRRALDLREPS